MKQITLKTPDDDNIRGTGLGSLDWTSASRMRKNVKRLMQTFDDTEKSKSLKNKTKVTCSECGKTFKTNNGKLPKHIKITYNFASTEGVKYCEGVASVNEKVKSVVINDIEYFIGDNVLYTIYTYDEDHKLCKITVDSKIKNIVYKSTKEYKFSNNYHTTYYITFDDGRTKTIREILDIVKL